MADDDSSHASEDESITSEAPEPEFLNPNHPTFLPEQGDFTILCYEDSGSDELRHAISVNLSDLQREAVAFCEAAAKNKDKTLDKVFISERSSVVLLWLSAAFEPSRAFVNACTSWTSFYRALRFSEIMQIDRARSGLFMAMLALVAESEELLPASIKITSFFAEAARQGESALTMASCAFERRCHKTRAPIKIKKLKLTERHFKELGAERCSDFVDAVTILIARGVFIKT